jgi:hypothetical protein
MSEEDVLEKTARNEQAARHNSSLLEYGRTSVAVTAGLTAGILGLTGLYGFCLYFIYSLGMSVILAIKVGSNWNIYFPSWRSIWLDGILGGLFTYVLLWTFIYGMIHVF